MESEVAKILRYIRNGVVVVVGIFIVGGLLTSMRQIDAGVVAAVTRFGRVTNRTLEPGFHLTTPFVEDIIKYNTKKVTYETAVAEKQKGSEANYKDYPVDTNTEDGQPVDISYTVRFSVDPTMANWIAQNIGNEHDLVEKIVKTESRVWARNIPRKYQAENLYTGEGSLAIQNEIFEILKPKFAANGLVLDFFGIREIAFEGSYVQAIRTKQEEQVKIETEKNRAEQEKYRKEQRITSAEAAAKEQELQRETLSGQVLEKLWLEKWDGRLPTIMLGDQATPLLQLPK